MANTGHLAGVADVGQVDQTILLSRRGLQYRLWAVRPPACNSFSRLKLVWEQKDLARFLRRLDTQANTFEIRALTGAVA